MVFDMKYRVYLQRNSGLDHDDDDNIVVLWQSVVNARKN